MKKNSILLNLLLMLGLSVLLVVSITWALKLYTKHHSNIPVPEVRGKLLGEAIRILSASDLYHEVVDSVYSREAQPGTVFEVIPAPGHEVKPGRIIFLRVYSNQQRRVGLPYVQDMSARQAIALLRGLGFEQIEQKIVPGPYTDLAKGITLRDGTPLEAGKMVSINTPIVLLVVGTVIDSLPPVEGLIEDGTSATGQTHGTRSDDPTNDDPEPNSWW